MTSRHRGTFRQEKSAANAPTYYSSRDPAGSAGRRMPVNEAREGSARGGGKTGEKKHRARRGSEVPPSQRGGG